MNVNTHKITSFLQDISVAEHYKWKIPFNKGYGGSMFSMNELNTFNGLTNFESSVLLKTVVSKKIIAALENNDKETLMKIFEWIVHDWGGIRNGRKNIENLYNLGVEAIKNENLNFYRIASTSKILSFYNPLGHCIYDSRVAYSLNAIMLFSSASEKYFPVPAGTNPKMNAFNIEVLIRLKHKENIYQRTGSRNFISNGDKVLFFKQDEAYSIINETLKKINYEYYRNDPDKKDKPFYTEMLLFGIADTLIYDNIFNRIKIEIENPHHP